MKRRPNKKKVNMKARILLATLSAAALTAITLNATAGDVYLSPRAAGNQVKHVSGVANDPNLINTADILVVTPRTAGNQAKTVAGTDNDVNPAIACARNMAGSPKAIQACTEHPATMPGCNAMTVAPLK